MANTKIPSELIADNAVGITQLNVSDGTDGQALVTNGSGTLSFASVGVSGISSSANATAITINSSEQVGIGTTSPDVDLEIATSASDTGVDLKLNGNKSSNGAVGSIIFENASDSVAMIRASRVGGNNDAADMQFYTQANGGSNSERARITSDGYFLIGTTSVAATVLDGTGGSNNALVIGDTGNPYPVLALQSSHQNWLADYITNDGSLRTYNTTSNYETMITTTAGAVTFPKTPSVHAEQVASNSGGGAVCIFTSTFHNIGGHYNTSNGRFTAPVAGRYLVTCSLLFNPDTNGEYARMLLAKNGATDTNYWDTLQDLNLSSLADYWAQNASCVIQLAANDYLEVQNQSQFSTYGGSYSQFCVHLLG